MVTFIFLGEFFEKRCMRWQLNILGEPLYGFVGLSLMGLKKNLAKPKILVYLRDEPDVAH